MQQSKRPPVGAADADDMVAEQHLDSPNSTSPQSNTWRDHVSVHPAADLLPLMAEAELKELAEDIKANGLRENIKVWWDHKTGENYLIDGRNRADALALIGESIFDGDDWNCEYVSEVRALQYDDPFDYVLSLNVRRRHLTAEQKRDVIAKLLKAKPEQSNRQIAKEVGADHKTVGAVRASLEAGGEIPHVEKTVGSDGKSYNKKTSKPKPATNPATELRRQADQADRNAARARKQADDFAAIGRESDEELYAPERELLEQLEYVVGRYLVGMPGDYGWIAAAKVLNKLYSKVTSFELTAETHHDRWPGYVDGREIQYEIQAAVTPPNDGGAAS